MTREEKQTALQRMAERKMALQATMAESDAHAAKCMKMGLVFREEYPEEYTAYEAAREEYNTLEAEANIIATTEVEDDEMMWQDPAGKEAHDEGR